MKARLTLLILSEGDVDIGAAADPAAGPGPLAAGLLYCT